MSLIGDALIIANEAAFDVFNALTLMDNVPVLQDLKVSGIKLMIAPPRLTKVVWRGRWFAQLLFVQLENLAAGGNEWRGRRCTWEGNWRCHAVRLFASYIFIHK